MDVQASGPASSNQEVVENLQAGGWMVSGRQLRKHGLNQPVSVLGVHAVGLKLALEVELPDHTASTVDFFPHGISVVDDSTIEVIQSIPHLQQVKKRDGGGTREVHQPTVVAVLRRSQDEE
jgi:hypothetical protein